MNTSTNKTELSKTYEPNKTEQKWYDYWVKKDYFHAGIDTDQKTYSIVIPPPNVTGSLHMGHALNNTLQDILIRWKRMDGYNTLWMPGTDHAGIATQNVVEKQLAQEGKHRHDYGREKFIEKVWRWREESGGVIINQLKKIGASCDWERERFTMDEGLSAAVREVFVRLYEEGLIYRDNYIVNWCPRCHTALSDLEVEYEEKKGFLYYIKYPLQGSKKYVVVATTRPETILGDTAVAVNPKDNRYKKFINKKVILPILNREIPIIEDHYVDIKFGTGAVKITPAHDPNDFEIGLRHHLPQIKVMDENAKMNAEAGKYQGLDRFACRKDIMEDLKKGGYIQKIEDYVHAVGHCYRCKTVVEPTLSMQWFVKMKDLAEPAIEAVKNKDINIIPKSWENTYFEWMYNIRDWCISRQIWWGHRIPAWYCDDCGQITVSRKDPAECSFCHSPKIHQETDVLDTWFSSGLWPFSTMGWPEDTKELQLFYPTSVLVTGFDILFFWVARMIMLGLKFMKEVPFKDVYIHALIRDSEGQKMSKSKGNVIDPLVMIEKYGTDAFRFTLAAFAAQGRDIRLSEERINGYRNFANKIWNASRFVLINLSDYNPQEINLDALEFEFADRWILSRLNKTIRKTINSLEKYKFNEAANNIYQFIWHELCDWYIEMIKPRLYQEDNDNNKRLTAQYVILYVLETTLRLLHPFMPFITEEIWQHLPHQGESIMVAPYPKYTKKEIDTEAEEEMILIMDIITGIRNIRSDMNINPSQKVNAIIKVRNDSILQKIKGHLSYIKYLAKVENVELTTNLKKELKSSAITVLDNAEIYIPLEGIINFEEEKKRLEKELRSTQNELSLVNKKLSNEEFLNKAPQDVIEKNKKAYTDITVKKEMIEERIDKIKNLIVN